MIFLCAIPAMALEVLGGFLSVTPFVGNILSFFINLLVFILTIFITIVLIEMADKQISLSLLPSGDLPEGDTPPLPQKSPSFPLYQRGISARGGSALGGKGDLKTALGKAWGLWFNVLLIALVVGLIQIGGFILLIVPGLIFSIWFAFAIYYVILEKMGIKESLKKSKELTKGKFWGIAARIIFPSLIWSMFGWAVNMIFLNLIDIVVKYAGGTFDKWAVYLLEGLKIIGANYIEAVFIPFLIITMVILFRDLQTSAKQR
ncbi:MAG: hypothetical protein WC659_06645 [Patescibacteria group bacterium]